MQLEADFDAFAAVMLAVSQHYNRKLPSFIQMSYWKALERFDIGDVERAVELHLGNPDTCAFMPQPGELVKLLEGSGKDRAAVALAKVREAVRRMGAGPSLVFDDPVIHAALAKSGGFLRWCDETTWNIEHTLGPDFQGHYRAFVAQGLDALPPYPAVLRGEDEIDAERWGRPAPAPRLLGDRDAAQAVMRGGVQGRGPTLLGEARPAAVVALVRDNTKAMTATKEAGHGAR